jgi:hypothetical protein
LVSDIRIPLELLLFLFPLVLVFLVFLVSLTNFDVFL